MTGLFATPYSPKPLRPHQERAVEMLRSSLARGNKRTVCAMPTGAGKTRTAAEIVNLALGRGRRVAFTVPAISLVDQTVEAFEAEGIDSIGVMQASHHRTDRRQPVQVVSVQTLARRSRPDADFVIVDEAHVRSEAVQRWMAEEPGKVFIGLSATPWARGMAEHWQDVVIPTRMSALIGDGLLAPFRVFAPSHPDMSGVKISKGDYAEDGAAEVMGGLTADIVTTWLQKGERRPSLVFAVNRAHAAQLVEQFALAGVGMGYCDANTDAVERRLLLDRVKRGELAGIVNIGTLTTGVDAPFISCIVLARPTRSEMLFVQIVGRGLRTCEGKADCLVLDHADNHARLGFVTDIHHDRLLSGAERKEPTRKEKGEPMPKECGSCGILKPAKVAQCPACGFKPERQFEIEVEDGELIEITRGKAPKPTRNDKQRFWSMARFVDIERGKGGRLAKALYKGKFGVWPQGLDGSPIPPDGEFLSYERSRRIAYAKRRENERAAA